MIDPSPSGRRPYDFGRLAKLVTRWANHLYYWVYVPCVLLVTALLIAYQLNSFWPEVFSDTFNTPLFIFLLALGLGVSCIAFRRVMSTKAMNVAIHVVPLMLFSIIAILYRGRHPEGSRGFQLVNGTSVDYVVEEEQVVENGEPKVGSDGQPVMRTEVGEEAGGPVSR